MKKPNITEGEWECSPGRYKGNKTMNVSTEEANILFRSVNINAKPREEEKANAKAISAVPEMIDALIGLVELSSDAISSHGYDPSKEKDILKAESALKKAGVKL